MSETSTAHGTALTDEEVDRLDAYWRAANYLSVGQIYGCSAIGARRPGST
jgi:xylulose-5-phosphate/fructose-6-phosphate phosphoketolase